MKNLPDAILEMAMQKLERKGHELVKIHPKYASQQEVETRAYEVMRAKLTEDEISAVEAAWFGDSGIHFDVAYIAGVMDGAKAGEILSKAEGAATR